MNIGEMIKKRREELGMSQDELATKCGYTSRFIVSKIENGKSDLTSSRIQKFADALGVSPDWFFYGDSNIQEFIADLTPEEFEFLEEYRKADDATKKLFKKILEVTRDAER